MATPATNLILGMHGHQPVGNFGWVFGEAYAKCYRPFLDVVERYPTITWAVHFSGPLVDWLETEHPEFLRRLAALVKRGQVEVMSGGYAEPIFALIPERDGIGQIRRFTDQLTRWRLGPCRGAWLPERVWEPSLPRLFRQAGMEYTVVDDHHLTLAGLGEQAAWGYWMTEDAGSTLALFPSSKALRYLVPFQPVEQVIEHLRALRSDEGRAVVLADDVEKFGLWPGTFRWVYEEGWLNRFCQALVAEQSWLKTYTFSQFLAAEPPRGRVYVPCASYQEMLQWSGGYFRNFLTKYPEANTMQKKMLWVSGQVEQARSGKASAALRTAETHLYRGQCNCAYWHGVFGGIYLNHLRSAVFRELLAAERALDRPGAWVAAEAADFDGDGHPDLLLRTGGMDAWIDLWRGGAIVEWDDKSRGINLTNTLARRPEAYHEKLKAQQAVAVGVSGSETPQTIHAELRVKEPDLQEHLIYDPYRCAAAIDHLWRGAGIPDAQAWARRAVPEGAALAEQPYQWRVERASTSAGAILHRDVQMDGDGGPVPVRLTKRISLLRGTSARGGHRADKGRGTASARGGHRRPELCVEYTLANLGTRPVRLTLGTEWNLALKDPHFNRIGAVPGARRLIVTDSGLDVSVESQASVPAHVWYFPVETVSDSEGGLERTYQHLHLTFCWTVDVAPRKPWRVVLTQRVGSGGVHAPV